MNPAQLKKLLANRELARRRLLHFTKMTHGAYDAGWVHDDICRRLEKFSKDVAEGKSPRLMLLMPPRHGKQLADSTPVLTPRGWTTHGGLREGDEVFHPSGAPVKIRKVSEKTPSNWVVTLSNGERVRCHQNHEWAVYDRAAGRAKVLSTQCLADRKLVSGGRNVIQLPEVSALRFSERALVMEPYVLGAWLGDGSRSKPCITGAKGDAAIIDACQALGYEVSAVCEHKDTGVLTTYFSGPKPNVSGRMTRELKELGLRGQKLIPEAYLRSSLEQRLALLAGLIDTDGHCDGKGRCRFTTTDLVLAQGVEDLCMTLGFRPYTTTVQPGLSSSGIQGRKPYYVVGFQPTMPIPCALERKRPERFAPQRRVAVAEVSFEPNGEQGHCIEVDSSDGLYLAGKQLVPTHNSELASIRFPAWHLGLHPTHEIINVGYNTELPMKFSRKVREVMRENMYQGIFPKAALDPNSQSVEAWYTTAGGSFTAAGVGGGITGKGAHCAYFKVRCSTQRGTIPISEVCVGDRVLAYDHKTQRDCWTTVRAVSTQYKPKLVQVAGTWVTPDHLVWTEESGYIEARYVTKDHTLRVSPMWPAVRPGSEGAQAQRAPVRARDENVLFSGMRQPSSDGAGHLRLRPEESAARSAVSGLFFTIRPGAAQLRALRECFRAYGQRARKEHPSARREFKGFLPASLLRSLSSSASCATTGVARGLRRLWRRGYCAQSQVLQSEMLPFAQSADFAIRRNVEQRETGSGETLRADVLELRQRAGSHGCAPHRPQRGASRPGQSGASVRGLPQPLSSSLHGVCAESLAHLLPEPGEDDYRVVDLQTDTSCFFIEDVLVHNCLIIDDPIKNQEEADNVSVRDKLWDWYQSTAYTRLAPGGGVLAIETWWNDDDLAGRLQEAMRKDPEADQFEIVKYPAISDQFEYRNDQTNEIVCFDEDPNLLEGDDATKGLTLLRGPDECLHEGRYPLDALKRIKANLQPRIWSALYQQNPVPDEGMYFRKDYFREQQTFPQTFGLRIYTAWDFAIGEKQVNDYTVGATLLQDENDVLYVLDVHRFRGDSFQIVEAMLDVTERYGMLAGVDYQVGAEDGQIWRSIEPLLKRRMGERRLFPTIEPLRPITDKAARARPLQGRMQQGRVVFPVEAHWKGAATTEMLRFPAGAHDDVVDALAWAVRLTMLSEPPQRQPERRLPSWRDKLTASGNAGSHMTA